MVQLLSQPGFIIIHSFISQIMPVQSYVGIHGSNGVTSICWWRGSIYSTGRDGYCRQFVIERGVASRHWKLVDVNKFHVRLHTANSMDVFFF